MVRVKVKVVERVGKDNGIQHYYFSTLTYDHIHNRAQRKKPTTTYMHAYIIYMHICILIQKAKVKPITPYTYLRQKEWIHV